MWVLCYHGVVRMSDTLLDKDKDINTGSRDLIVDSKINKKNK